VGGIECNPVPVEITYGLERVATFIQGVENHFDINWNGLEGEGKLTYKDVFLRAEREFSAYNFDRANTPILFQHFKDCEQECDALLKSFQIDSYAHHSLILPAYEQCVKANHYFNLLDARGVISVTERAGYIARVRDLAKKCCEAWVASLEEEVA
jgi:glycyl-tRNA synthetase alpha chain